ncbi:MAG: type I restriction enzyme HsdR N-terminal domain-containing protein [Bacteroidia bacterium]|jgi:hypothetical protein|nr:type I restriction enzyme HsdR N-terminal domain-containing protein [Bacteroidia bacterium]
MNIPHGFPELNFPAYSFRLRDEAGEYQVFDPVRKKFVALTPEEWVRQHVIMYLKEAKGYPLSLLMVEKQFKLNRLVKRADIVAYNNSGKAALIVECKSSEVAVSQDTFDQAVRYNLALRVKYLIVTNGINTYCCSLENGEYSALTDVPEYSLL